MPNVTGKRKREALEKKAGTPSKKNAANGKPKKAAKSPEPELQPETHTNGATEKSKESETPLPQLDPNGNVTIQIVTGSYERVLHGVSASIPCKLLRKSEKPKVTSDDTTEASKDSAIAFTDTFLFTPHTSSIRCLALSPPTEGHKRFLATGSTDERINLFSLSTRAPKNPTPRRSTDTLNPTPSSTNPHNRTLGALLHHTRPLTSLTFLSKTKLLSSAEDNHITITRTRDWTALSSIKAPHPTPTHRPSGDTAAAADLPAGVNAFAAHPSAKLLLSVGRGEKCLRLWNLMTGKRAGVLGFDRALLAQVGEGRFGGAGEGRSVLWDSEGGSFVVGFERGVVVFGLDSKPKKVVRTVPGSKVHRVRFLPGAEGVLAVATEDGRVALYDVRVDGEAEVDAGALPVCPCVGVVGGRAAGVLGRVKDFEVLELPGVKGEVEAPLLCVTGSSDGAVRLWSLFPSEIALDGEVEVEGQQEAEGGSKSVGTFLGMLETSARITCLGGFVMDEPAQGEVEAEVDMVEAEEDDKEASDSDEEDSE